MPLIFYGPGFIKPQGDISLDRQATSADLVATLAELVDSSLPEGRPGTVIEEALVPEEQRPGTPNLILTVVWDGAGWNVLNRWPDAWPHLRGGLGGTSVRDAIVGSSPSTTPAIHATIGAGAFPNQHGIVDIPLRIGSRMVGSWPNETPKYLEIPTFADLYDQQTGNQSKVGMVGARSWHLGMMGQGAYLDGGDKDYGVMFRGHGLFTNPQWYELPAYLEDLPDITADARQVDLDDGQLDSAWMGHEVLGNPVDAWDKSPAGNLYTTRLIKALVSREQLGEDEVTDLLFVNYKQIDYVGHVYNMLQPEMREMVGYSDRELAKLFAYLDDEVGKGQWVMAMTADHGSTPDALATGAWPISMRALESSIAEHFGVEPGALFQEERGRGYG